MADEQLCQYGRSMAMEQLEALMAEVDGVRLGTDIEHVHRMRVASRRLRSILRLFRPCFKGKKGKAWREAVREVTKGLGEARDLDVQMALIGEMGEGRPEEEGFGLIISHLKARREALQPGIVALMDRLCADGPLAVLQDELEGACWEGNCSALRHHAFVQASIAVDDMYAHAGSVPLYEDVEGRHALRIAGKRLRYALEAFQQAYDDGLRDEIRAMKGLQDTIGEMHDCDVWLQRVPSLMEELPAAGGALDILERDMEGRRRVLHGKLMETWCSMQQDRFFPCLLLKLDEGGDDALAYLEHWAADLHRDPLHARQVRSLALALFDHLKGLHRLGESERRSLELAAIVHDVGLSQGSADHQRVALDIIMGADLPIGKDERRMVACISRYHGVRSPRESDKVFRDLSKRDRKTVRKLSAILALADALDVEHGSRVTSVSAKAGRKAITITLEGNVPLPEEIGRGNFKKGQMERTFKRRVCIEQRSR